MYSIVHFGTQVYLFVHKIAFNNKFIAAIYWCVITVALVVVMGLVMSFTGNLSLGILASIFPSVTMIFFAHDIVSAFRDFLRKHF